MRELVNHDETVSAGVHGFVDSPSRECLPQRHMIRVAFVGQAGAIAGGAERTLATHLSVAAPDLNPTVVLFEEGAFADEVRGMGITVEIVRAPDCILTTSRERVGLNAIAHTFEHAARVARRLSELHIDVIYANTMKAHFVCALAARLARIPCVMHFHDLVDGPVLAALRLAALFGSIERVACARVVAKSLGLNRTPVSYGPVVFDLDRILPSKADARERLGLPQDIPIVGLVGRINRWKGHDRFIRIAAAIRNQTPVHFAIVGSPIFRDFEFLPELVALVDTLGISKDVTFLPWTGDMHSVYAAIDVNANCSTREPFGRSIVEAAVVGVPSVCFDDSGAAETILNRCTGRVVPAGDEAAFGRAILECLTSACDPETRTLVRYSARRFDARVIAEEIAEVVRRAADPIQDRGKGRRSAATIARA